MAVASVKQDTVWKLASFGELELLKAQIEQGVSVDFQDDRGFTPLNWAARNNHAAVVSYLIEQGKSIETPSFGGLRPLHHACNKNLERVVKILLTAKADPNATDEGGDSPMHFAAARGVLNIVVALLEAGAIANTTNSQGICPIHKACIFGQLGIVRKFVTDCGIDPNTPDNNGDTPLHFAARCGFPLIVKCLLDAKADASIKNGAGHSAAEVALNSAIKQLFSTGEENKQ